MVKVKKTVFAVVCLYPNLENYVTDEVLDRGPLTLRPDSLLPRNITSNYIFPTSSFSFRLEHFSRLTSHFCHVTSYFLLPITKPQLLTPNFQHLVSNFLPLISYF